MKFYRVLLLVLLLATFCGAAWAQDTASITGTVTDPSGAAVSGAKDHQQRRARHHTQCKQQRQRRLPVRIASHRFLQPLSDGGGIQEV